MLYQQNEIFNPVKEGKELAPPYDPDIPDATEHEWVFHGRLDLSKGVLANNLGLWRLSLEHDDTYDKDAGGNLRYLFKLGRLDDAEPEQVHAILLRKPTDVHAISATITDNNLMYLTYSTPTATIVRRYRWIGDEWEDTTGTEVSLPNLRYTRAMRSVGYLPGTDYDNPRTVIVGVDTVNKRLAWHHVNYDSARLEVGSPYANDRTPIPAETIIIRAGHHAKNNNGTVLFDLMIPTFRGKIKLLATHDDRPITQYDKTPIVKHDQTSLV